MKIRWKGSLSLLLVILLINCVCYFYGKSIAAHTYSIALLLLFSMLLQPTLFFAFGWFIARFIRSVQISAATSFILRLVTIAVISFYALINIFRLVNSTSIQTTFMNSNPWIFTVLGVVLYLSIFKKKEA